MNCAECQQPAAVYNGGTPLCGTCFYKRSLDHHEQPDVVRHDVWRRLTDAITALEMLVARISGEVDDLTKRRDE